MSNSMKRAFSVIGGFFILLWAGIAYTLTLAFGHFEPVVDPNYSIKKGDEQVAAADRWTIRSAFFEKDTVARGELPFAFAVSAEKTDPADATELEVRLERPATLRGSHDWTLAMADGRLDAGGVYHHELNLPLQRPGFWEIEIRAKNAEGQVSGFARHRVFVQ